VCAFQYPISGLLRGEVAKTHVYKTKYFGRKQGRDGSVYTLRTANTVAGEKSDGEYELNDRWLVTRSTLTSRSGQTAGVQLLNHITYTTLGDRMLPERVTLRRIEPSGREVGSVVEFRNYQVYSGNRADFSLTQFGLPEAIDYEVEEPSRLWLYLLAGAVTCLAAAGLFRWLSRRHPAAVVSK
jgi:hypothetical protein